MQLNFRFPKVPLLACKSSPFGVQKFPFWKAIPNALEFKSLQNDFLELCYCINIQKQESAETLGKRIPADIFLIRSFGKRLYYFCKSGIQFSICMPLIFLKSVTFCVTITMSSATAVQPMRRSKSSCAGVPASSSRAFSSA